MHGSPFMRAGLVVIRSKFATVLISLLRFYLGSAKKQKSYEKNPECRRWQTVGDRWGRKSRGWVLGAREGTNPESRISDVWSPMDSIGVRKSDPSPESRGKQWTVISDDEEARNQKAEGGIR
jgi:hypothetical protein